MAVQTIENYINPNVRIMSSESLADLKDNGTFFTGVDANDLAAILAQKHPVYQQYVGQWVKWYDWYTGDNIGKYIYQHVRERAEAYKRRQERAFYFNYVQSIIDLIGSFIFSRAIIRSFFTASPEELSPSEQEADARVVFWNDCDLKDTPIDIYMRGIFTFAQIFGYIDVVVDMPRSQEMIL